jgi:predicted DNA-binding protein (MmcQ/YjbR family)
MNKKHWNTVYFELGLPKDLLIELIDHSYQLVVEGLPKKLQEALLEFDE